MHRPPDRLAAGLSDHDNLLPGNATAFERAQSQTSARLLDTDTDIIRRARNPLQTPRSLLAPLAWERSVHHWPDDDASRRSNIDSAFADHLSYGTPVALEAEIAQDTGLEIRIVEFFEDRDLEWPDFIVAVTIDPGDAPPDLSGVISSAILRKNVRDWPAKLRVFARQPVAPLYIGAASHASPHLRVRPQDTLPLLPGIYIGATTRALPRMRVLPQ